MRVVEVHPNVLRDVGLGDRLQSLGDRDRVVAPDRLGNEPLVELPGGGIAHQPAAGGAVEAVGSSDVVELVTQQGMDGDHRRSHACGAGIGLLQVLLIEGGGSGGIAAEFGGATRLKEEVLILGQVLPEPLAGFGNCLRRLAFLDACLEQRQDRGFRLGLDGGRNGLALLVEGSGGRDCRRSKEDAEGGGEDDSGGAHAECLSIPGSDADHSSSSSPPLSA